MNNSPFSSTQELIEKDTHNLEMTTTENNRKICIKFLNACSLFVVLISIVFYLEMSGTNL
jgi:hypothetical protein